MPLFSPTQWLLAVAAAFGMGVSKAGFAGQIVAGPEAVGVRRVGGDPGAPGAGEAPPGFADDDHLVVVVGDASLAVQPEDRH